MNASADPSSAGDGAWPLLRTLTAGLLAARRDLVDMVADSVRREVAYYRTGPVPPEVVRSSAEALLVSLLGVDTEADAGAPQRLGGKRAVEGIPLEYVIDAVRAGSGFLWRQLVDYARSLGNVSDARLVELASQVWLMHDAFARGVQEGYRGEQTRRLLVEQQARAGLIYGLVDPQSPLSPAAVFDRLGLPRSGGYLVVAAAADAAGRPALAGIEQLLAGDDIVSAWAMVSTVQLGLVGVASSATLERTRAALDAAGTTAGMSPVMTDIVAVALAVRLARTALAASRSGRVTAFDELPVDMAAAASPEVAAVIRRRVLGPVLEAPDRDVLLETLAVWFDAGGSAAEAARTLYVHANTVRNRVQRVARLTGRDFSRPRDAAEVYLALVSRSPASPRVPDLYRPHPATGQETPS